jgi:hypothetical protein
MNDVKRFPFHPKHQSKTIIFCKQNVIKNRQLTRKIYLFFLGKDLKTTENYDESVTSSLRCDMSSIEEASKVWVRSKMPGVRIRSKMTGVKVRSRRVWVPSKIPESLGPIQTTRRVSGPFQTTRRVRVRSKLPKEFGSVPKHPGLGSVPKFPGLRSVPKCPGLGSVPEG